ncbi:MULTISPECIES: hydrogenase maturation protease [unclassified Clostridium]|uniref:hydrogenase maturation protease n=1 Tax=unclassified Clostridium TaxID=2614128 RepID=UPI000E8684CB|nr:hydrogenase maturation protease [Clostridium sp.]
MIKIFAIGNIILGDDGIGVKVMEFIGAQLESYSKEVKVLIVGIDYIYYLNEINKEDTVILVDSTYFGIEPGRVSVLNLKECDKFINPCRDMHSENLLRVLREEYREIAGYLVGIEVEKVNYSLELSNTLKDKFSEITKKVFREIKRIIGDINA